ncbi:MAG TPA: NADH-quinone oxidoreductase subunit D [Chthonomonadaceae bacterium]|jgi:NADH-quinone oxidoreductase subunit D|nr:NADH-quinone oxidoreductase subunit D [Chthonomonadaceae bacterium]
MTLTTTEISSPGMTLNMGPQHPSTHGVLRLVVELDGEIIRSCRPVIGYLHRGLEKMFEARPYRQNVPFTDRLDYLASLNSNLAMAQAIERIGGVAVPERGQYLRVLLCELNRIASHLVFLGTFATDLGATTVFLYSFREREKVLDLLEAMTGARLTYNWIRAGGVPTDLPEGYAERVRAFLREFLVALDENDRLLTGNRIFRARCEGVGVLSREMAIAYGASGPVARGSGIPYDIRRIAPYDVYDRMEFDVPVFEEGDCMARYKVRIEEMRQSARIIEQCLREMPEGEVMTKLPKIFKPPAGEAYSRTESPRGELSMFMVSDGSPNPARVHVRAPSFVHLALLPALLPGTKIADVIAILGSLDTVLGEVDR